MSDNERFPDEHWTDLPLPDGDQAWQKMKLLLDKDDRRRAVPFWLWPYGVAGLLAVSLAAGAWFWFNRYKPKAPATAVRPQAPQAKQNAPALPDLKTPTAQTQTVTTTPANEAAVPPRPTAFSLAPYPTETTSRQQTSISKTSRRGQGVSHQPAGNANGTRTQRAPLPTGTPTEAAVPKAPAAERQTPPVPLAAATGPTDTTLQQTPAKKEPPRRADSLAASPLAAVVEESKQTPVKKQPLIWSAGLGLQRFISLPGQTSSAYAYTGKRSTLADNIPAVYLRLQKGRWYVQGEFNYAVPQAVERFSFSQQTQYDAANGLLNTERLEMQKLYYHQLPLSLNFHVLPQWSVGAGAVYSLFAGAVTERELASKNVQSGTETVSRSVAPVRGYTDSFLYRTTAGLLLQTDYHWKRVSVGLRYSQNLQPFIKYTKPSGEVLAEKTNALQAVLRFRLWEKR